MRTDARIAWTLVLGSDRREWWRIALTSAGALLATGLALAAVTVSSVSGQVSIAFGHGLLNQPGQRTGVVATLVLLLVPVFGFLGQCARIGAVHRDRRTAALRLAGASPRQVRRIAALESAPACLVGAVAGFAVFAAVLAGSGRTPPPLAWAGFVVVVLGVPVVAALVSGFALRKVIAEPLGRLRRTGHKPDRRTALAFVLPAIGVAAAAAVSQLSDGSSGGGTFPPLVLLLVLLFSAGALWAAGASAAFMGRRLTAGARSPAVLIAAGRLRQDPWAAARTHSALLLVTVVGTAFVGVREVVLAALRERDGYAPADLDFYTTGLDLTGAAVLVALLVGLCGLAVGAAESLATRRRGLAAQAAAGVPRAVLTRALLLETALPLAPATLLAGAGGMTVHLAYATLVDPGSFPSMLPLLVPVAVYAACLLAAATSLPLLRRMARPAELRFT
ncbi:FtsX-like permease family protein [Streptomyces sp. NPDC088727]|uniref:FtsX-like permease family protein n=1 Tax=Streptomyces sp. NPDC088727 TaxID=3365875 RepID=UPI003813EC56